MTPLSEALTAAQRSALAALEKAYVAGQIEGDAMREALRAVGISDPVDIDFLLASLDVLREWGVAAPTMGERITEAKVEPATQKQLAYMVTLLDEKGIDASDRPSGPFTTATASQIIDALKRGTYHPKDWVVPF